MAASHLRSAVHFARLSSDVESQHATVTVDDSDTWFGALSADHAYVTACVLTSVAFLEAAINELFIDICHSPNHPSSAALGAEVAQMFRSVWDLDARKRGRFAILDKYDFALILAGRSSLDRGSHSMGDVHSLIDLRNSLTHCEPEWVDVVFSARVGDGLRPAEQRLGKKLARKFAPNPLATDGLPFFPAKCLGFGCASWALRTCTIFFTLFFNQLGIPMPRQSELESAKAIMD